MDRRCGTCRCKGKVYCYWIERTHPRDIWQARNESKSPFWEHTKEGRGYLRRRVSDEDGQDCSAWEKREDG